MTVAAMASGWALHRLLRHRRGPIYTRAGSDTGTNREETTRPPHRGPLVLGPGLRPVATRYLAADAAHGDCSSSEVRRRVAAHEPLEGLVPRAIRADVRRLYARRGDKCA